MQIRHSGELSAVGKFKLSLEQGDQGPEMVVLAVAVAASGRGQPKDVNVQIEAQVPPRASTTEDAVKLIRGQAGSTSRCRCAAQHHAA